MKLKDNRNAEYLKKIGPLVVNTYYRSDTIRNLELQFKGVKENPFFWGDDYDSGFG